MTEKKIDSTDNDLQNTTQKTKDWATRILYKPGMNSGVICVLKKLHEFSIHYSLL